MKAAPGIGGDGFVRVQKVGPHWIEMDVIANGAQIAGRIAIDEERFVTSAKDVAEEFVAVVEANGVGAEKPAHAFDQVRFRRLRHQVKMISHETVGVHLPAGFLAGFSQRFEEIMPVNVVEKDILAPIAAAHQVVNRTRKLNSKLAGHWSAFKLRAHLRKEESNSLRTDPFVLLFGRMAFAVA
jgi:hypothetical protein